MTPPRMLVILPAFNEAENLPKTLTRIRQTVPLADILVVNDGSWDNTTEVAKAHGARVLEMPYNVGIGAGVQTAFQFAHRYGYDIVVRNDGDGQHAPDGITRLVEALETHQYDVVVGSRFLQSGDYGTSPARLIGINILRSLLQGLTGWRITDPTSGFGAFNRRAIALFAQFYPHDYPEPESILLLYRCGFTMGEIPITMQPRQHGRSSITTLRSIYYMVKVILALLIQRMRRKPAL
jgi:glycosyltransferase involved in cell wall biosynthesis